jgi:hypothetical protein
MSNDLTENEETIAFYHQLGLAITAWAHVEQSLCWVVSASFTKHNAVQTAHGFFSIQSFRAKLQFADRVFKSKRWPQKHVKKWNELYVQMQKQAELRNKLAHYISRGYPFAKPGRRRALLPYFIAPTKHRQRVPSPPSEALCIRDIVHARYKFNALAFSLESLSYALRRQKSPLPASLAQEKNAPTMAQLTREIRTLLTVALPDSNKVGARVRAGNG